MLDPLLIGEVLGLAHSPARRGLNCRPAVDDRTLVLLFWAHIASGNFLQHRKVTDLSVHPFGRCAATRAVGLSFGGQGICSNRTVRMRVGTRSKSIEQNSLGLSLAVASNQSSMVIGMSMKIAFERRSFTTKISGRKQYLITRLV